MAKDSAVNPDGSLFIGRGEVTEEFAVNVNRQASGLPPAGAVDVTARFNGEDVPVPVNVARDALYKHMASLQVKISAEIHDPYKFAGNGPYLGQMRAQWQTTADMANAEKERARAELESLGKMNDAEVVRWAVECGHIGRSHRGDWVAA